MYYKHTGILWGMFMSKKYLKIFLYLIAMLFLSLLLHPAFSKSSLVTDNGSFTVEEATIHSVHAAIKNHQITCEQLVSFFTLIVLNTII